MGQILGMIRVKQSSVAIKKSFGKFDGVLQPGCHCVPWCCGSNIAGRLSMRLQILRFRFETKTKDDVFVSLTAVIEYKVMPEKAFMVFYESNTRQCIQDHAINAIGASVANLSMHETYEKKQDIAAAVEEDLKKVTLDCGIEIVHILIVAVEVAEITKRAMIEIDAAARRIFAKDIMEMKKARVEVESENFDEKLRTKTASSSGSTSGMDSWSVDFLLGR